MAVLEEVLAANETYVSDFEKGELTDATRTEALPC